MKRRVFNFAAGVSLVLSTLSGCVQVSTGRFAIHGREVTRLVGPGKAVELGVSNAAGVRRELGDPLVTYGRDTTDIFEAVPRYRWVLQWWPVALINQRRPGDPRVLVRLDYDERAVVRQYRTTTTTGPVIRFAVPADMNRAWPDLRERKPVAFGK